MTIQRLVRAALIAAVYIALCTLLAPFSYGPIQIRVAEALSLLVVLCPEAVVGVTLGCFLANLFSPSFFFADLIVGTLATLLAALASRRLRHLRWHGLPLASSLPPVLFNAVLVGAELTIFFLPGSLDAPAGAYLFNMLTVGVGQVISCCFMGVGLVWFIEKSPPMRRLFCEEPA